MTKKKVAFICVHNSCRSHIAEALGKHLRGDEFDFYSAGTQTKPQINQDAVRLIKQLYGINMEQTQYSKTIDKIPAPDIAISMGCDVGCPYIGRAFDDNWGLQDPTGQSDKFVKPLIEMYLHRLKYCVKLEKYRQEKEVRIITFTPKEDQNAECGKEKPTFGKSYKHIKLHKNSCLGVRVVGDARNDTRNEALKRLKERGCRLEYN